MTCSCGRIKVGMEVTEARNWNPDCPEHGLGTFWWKTVGKPRQDEQNARLRELQARAREARNGSH